MKLLEPFKLGLLELPNRVVMSPMTRSRADEKGLVGPLQATYYSQRATAGLIISEGVNISAQGQGSPKTPGIWNAEQVAAWRTVTDATHKAGGRIFAQLWHTGRVGHSLNKGGEQPVAPSALAIQGQKVFTMNGQLDYEVPRALTTDEVKAVVRDYATAAENAKSAGFDGVELHGAFGYLPNQFLVDGANQRTDEYGGNVENRTRFVIEVMKALVDVWGNGRVGIKISPTIPYNTMIDSDPLKTYSYLLSQLNLLPLAYVSIMQGMFPLDAFPTWPKNALEAFRPHYQGTIMTNGGYTRDTAEAALQSDTAQLVAFGTHFIANPDLVHRLEVNAELAAPDRATMYGGAEGGYTTYPPLNA